MKWKKEWISLLAALGAGVFVCGACLYRMSVTPGISSVEGVYGLTVKNLGVGTKKDDMMTQEVVTEIVSVGLSQGNHVVGEDMPAGTYQVYAWGNGEANVFVYESGELVSSCYVADKEGAAPYETMIWKDGQIVIVKGVGVGAHTETKVTYEKVEYGGSYWPYQCDLMVGEYRVGQDIPAGIYDFKVYADQDVTIESPRPYEGGISFVCSPSSSGNAYEEFSYDGVRLQEGDTLTIQADVWSSHVQVEITVP